MARGSIIKRYWRDGKRYSWAIKYRLPDGTQKLETIGASEKEAEQVLATRLRELRLGLTGDLQDIRFDEFAERWLSDYVSELKASTADGYRRVVEQRLVPRFGRYPIRAIRQQHIQEFVSELRRSGLKPNSVNNIFVVLRRMLQMAVKWRYLAANPAAGVDRVRVPHREVRVLTPEEVNRLLDAAKPAYRLVYLLAVHCGLRRGEIFGLKWRDIDWEARRIRVERTLWRRGFYPPKSKSSRRLVDLTDTAYNALAEARPDSLEGARERLIFPARDGGPRSGLNYITDVSFREALRAAGLPIVRFHDLRHTYASLLIASGEHAKYIQSQLGHSSITITLDLYGHMMPDVYGHGGKRLDRFLRDAGRASDSTS